MLATVRGWLGVPLALRYSVLDMSSIFSKASASSLANACSSSYSPGRPIRSRMIRPEPAHPDAQKMKMTRKMRTMEPKEDARPMMTPVKAEDGDVVIVMECFLYQVPAEAMEQSKNLAFARSEKRRKRDSEEPKDETASPPRRSRRCELSTGVW